MSLVMTTRYRRAVLWLLFGETGISSRTVLAVGLGLSKKGFGAPADPSDFGRCRKLLKALPWLRPLAFPRLMRRPDWKWLILSWDEMDLIYMRDLPTGRSSELFEIMQALRFGPRPVERIELDFGERQRQS